MGNPQHLYESGFSFQGGRYSSTRYKVEQWLTLVALVAWLLSLVTIAIGGLFNTSINNVWFGLLEMVIFVGLAIPAAISFVQTTKGAEILTRSIEVMDLGRGISALLALAAAWGAFWDKNIWWVIPVAHFVAIIIVAVVAFLLDDEGGW